jgi:uncharacterized protein (TIGR00369 family)
VTAAISGIDVLRQASSGEVPLPPAAALLGWEAIDIRPGYVRVRYAAREEFYNPQGAVQGGFLAAMLDDAMGPAIFTLLRPTEFAPTLEMKVAFLRPAFAGELIAEGRVVRRTRRAAFLEGKLFGPDGELVATASATALISESRTAISGEER